MAAKPNGPFLEVTSVEKHSLHWAYLEFAIQSSRVGRLGKRHPIIPIPRQIVEAIRYSYDFIDAAADYAHELAVALDRSERRDTWLARYTARNWTSLKVPDKLGLLAFRRVGEGFWRNDSQRILFEELRTVRNALTHPRIFGSERVSTYTDQPADGPVWTRETPRT